MKKPRGYPAAGGQRQRQPTRQLRSLHAVRSRAAEVAADQLRNQIERRAADRTRARARSTRSRISRRRQDELLKRSSRSWRRDRDKMSEEQLQRELEKLTREQSELRQRAREIARQTARQQNPSGSQRPAASTTAGRLAERSAERQSGTAERVGPVGAAAASKSSRGSRVRHRVKGSGLREQSDARRVGGCGRHGDLRRQDASQAAEAGKRAAALRGRSATSNRPRPTSAGSRQSATCGSAPAGRCAAPGGVGAVEDAARRKPAKDNRFAAWPATVAASAARARKLEESLRQQGGAARDQRPSGPARTRRGHREVQRAGAQAGSGEAAKIGRPEAARPHAAIGRRDASGLRGCAWSPRKSRAAEPGGSRPRSEPARSRRSPVRSDRIAEALAVGHGNDDRVRNRASCRTSSPRRRNCGIGWPRPAAISPARTVKTGRTDRGGAARRTRRQAILRPAAAAEFRRHRQAGPGAAGRRRQRFGRRDRSCAKMVSRQMRATEDLIDQIRRDDPSLARGDSGEVHVRASPRANDRHSAGDRSVQAGFRESGKSCGRQATQALENIGVVAVEEAAGEALEGSPGGRRGRQAPPECKRQVDE